MLWLKDGLTILLFHDSGRRLAGEGLGGGASTRGCRGAQAEEELCCHQGETGTTGSVKPAVVRYDPPTTFISLLVAVVAGTSMPPPAVWTDWSSGRKPRLSIKLRDTESCVEYCFCWYRSYIFCLESPTLLSSQYHCPMKRSKCNIGKYQYRISWYD